MALESIALIPSGYKATKVYSQLPVNGNGDFTFDRGTSTDQTRVNKNGLIESVAQDVPRLDYLDGGCPSLLLEPASTNLITYSEEFDNAAWGKSGSSVTANSVLSPDGSVNADTLVSTNTTGSFLFEPVTVTASTKYNISFFAKKSNTDYFGIVVIDGSDVLRQYYDINNGVVASTSVSFSPTYENVKIEDYGNGWYRCSLTYESAGTSLEVRPYVVDNDNDLNSASGSEVYLFGAQIEQQSYATSYMPSLSGVSGVRAVETCNSAGTTAEINSQEGVLFVEYKPSVDSASKQVTLSDGTTTERITIEVRDSGATFRFYSQNSTSSNTSADFSVLDNDVYYKVAYQYSATSLKIYVNGLLFDEITGTIYLPSGLNKLAFDTGTGSLPLLGRTKKLSVYDQALSTTELETLTGFTSFAEMSSYLSYS